MVLGDTGGAASVGRWGDVWCWVWRSSKWRKRRRRVVLGDTGGAGSGGRGGDVWCWVTLEEQQVEEEGETYGAG